MKRARKMESLEAIHAESSQFARLPQGFDPLGHRLNRQALA